MKPKIALTVIVKAGDDSEALQLANMLGSVNGYVDTIYLQLNAPKGVKIHPKMKAIANQFADEVFEYEWNNSFVAARNDLMSKVPKEYGWIIWADSDDLFEGAENIAASLAIMPDDIHGVYILYDYQKDEFGNVIVSHWVTRAVRNDGGFAWKSSFDDEEVSVHETLIAKRSMKAVANNEWKIVHNASPEHYKESLVRNIEILEGMVKRQATKPDGVDPRILYYLGSHYNEAYRFNEALELFVEYLKVSGWSEERAEAHIYIGRIIKNKGNIQQARTAFLLAMGENPKNPGAYLELGKLEAKEQRWEQAAEWLKRGVDIKTPISPMVRYSYDFELYTEYAQALSNLGGKNLTKALQMAQEALKLRPYDEEAKANRDRVEKLVEYRNMLRATARLIKEVEEDNVIPLLDLLPNNLQDSMLITSTRQQHTEGKKWPERSIAIYVGQGPLGIWGPWSMDEGGVGGSEEAVVRLSRELTKMGWNVTIFGTPGNRAGMDNYGDAPNQLVGANWKQYWELNAKDEFDVLISWRQPGFFDAKWNARRTYLWLHDVVEKEELTPERLNNITKVIYVSKYHSERSESMDVLSSKKLPSGNGIDPSTFTKFDGQFQRDLHRIIYMSANERGLRILLDIWPDIKKAVPDATLHPYYGWESFDAVNRDNPERMAWKATMVARMRELEGVSQSVRLGHDDLVKEMFKSGVWAYPSFFPEVNCITAQKAMAAGCWPVTSDFAALKDLIPSADQVPMNSFGPEDIERYKKRLIGCLKHPLPDSNRQEMMKWARQTFDWKNTATQWNKEMS